MRIISSITERKMIDMILTHLGVYQELTVRQQAGVPFLGVPQKVISCHQFNMLSQCNYLVMNEMLLLPSQRVETPISLSLSRFETIVAK